MTWKDVGGMVGKAAPLLGTVLGGPAGAAVGGAASLIASLFGCEPEPEAVMKAIQNDPENLVRLKDLEVQNRANILQWQTAHVQAEVEDRKSARQASVDGGDRTRLFWLSLFLFVVAFGLEGALLFFGFAVGISGELVGRVMGTVDTLAVMVGTFWFGTSRASQDNENRLYHSMPTMPKGDKP